MRIERISPPLSGADCLRFRFPFAGQAAPGALEPLAFLSLKSRGDMKYSVRQSSPGEAAQPCECNRRSFLASLGLEPASIFGAELHHTRRVSVVSIAPVVSVADGVSSTHEELFGPDPGPGVPAGARDGIMLAPVQTGSGFAPPPGRGASVTVADCMPIWILDRASGAFGVLHSGWKGTGILAVAAEALRKRFGSEPSSLSVILGPAIGACCYNVPEERAEGFAAEFGEDSVRREGDSFFLDLLAANLGLASRLGIGAVLAVEACTSCDLRFGSSRREGSANIIAKGGALGEGPAFTRMMALCCRPPEGFRP
jgi:copper oxidase (laccase) domain-containing protein